jgi:hypothetical protein
MKTNGFVLVVCLLFGLLAGVLALSALTLSQLSSQLDQGVLLQQQQLMAAEKEASAHGLAQQNLADMCEISNPGWPVHWQQCQLALSFAPAASDNSFGQLSLSWQVNPQTQGGEL